MSPKLVGTGAWGSQAGGTFRGIDLPDSVATVSNNRMESKRSFDSWQDIEFQNSRRVAKNIPMCTCEIDIAANACPQLPPGSGGCPKRHRKALFKHKFEKGLLVGLGYDATIGHYPR